MSTDLSVQTLHITGDEPVLVAFAIFAEHYLQQAREQENKAQQEKNYDIEAIHQYRVSLRKIRALLSLLKNEFPPTQYALLSHHLGFVARQTNELRDLDVFLDTQQTFYKAIKAKHHSCLKQLYSEVGTQQKQYHKRIQNWFSSPQYKKKLDEIHHAFNLVSQQDTYKTFTLCLHELVPEVYQKIVKKGQKIDTKSADKKFHQLRLKCKKLRYLSEFLQLLPNHKKAIKLQKKLKKLQNLLGQFNDYSVQKEKLIHLSEQYDASEKRHQAINALTKKLSKQQNKLKTKIKHGFAKFANKKTQKLIAQLSSQI
ncbi:CHAD domain-containing protein [Catenovulum sediminis]|uniref:CHAD domain-containing protein n=1 Tax=Catenovulum sediminis TaxID=1740262 RepID=A0ABV1RFW2_9ALTE|nr:CHAD domain-containing protein [Catenovulum sediminis]